MKRLIMILALVLAPLVAFAQSAQPACEDDKLIIGSGTATGTYAQMMQSLSARCTMVCESRDTQGGYDNISNILKKKFDGGIVQVDTLEFLNKANPSIKQNVRGLFSLHGSSIHIFAQKAGHPVTTTSVEKGWIRDKQVTDTKRIQISNITDLKGQKVAAWSSAFTTALIIDDRLRLNMDVVEVPTRAAGFKMLMSGEVAAFMGAGGFPLDWVEPINNSKPDVTTDMVMVNVTTDDLQRMGGPYYNTKAFYRSIGALGTNMITVRNEMVIWNITTGPRAKAVEAFQACFKKNLEDIQNSRNSHPSWVDVSVDTATVWEAYKPTTASTGPLRVTPLR